MKREARERRKYAIIRDEGVLERGRASYDLIWPQTLKILYSLGYDRAWWIGAVNRIANQDHWALSTATHVLLLLHRYLSAREKNPKTRDEEFRKIAEEVTEKMKGAEHSLYSNPNFTPDADYRESTWRDDTIPFTFEEDPGGIPAIYESLARFLASPFARRLERCKYCDGIFVSPDNRKRHFCPYTDHKKRFELKEQAERQKTEQGREYSREKQQEHRDRRKRRER